MHCLANLNNHPMRRVSPIDQLLCELDRLAPQDSDDLAIALVCLLRFGMKKPLCDLLDLPNP